MRARALLLAPVLAVGCAGGPDGRTLARLHDVEPDMKEVRVDDSLDQAMLGYRKFLEEAPESALTPEAMRRLADLKLEKEFGILGAQEPHGLPAPQAAASTAASKGESPERPRAAAIADHSESEEDFERRASSELAPARSRTDSPVELPGGQKATPAGPLEALELYDRILATYPDYEYNDQVLYQKARAYDELGRVDEAIAVIERLIAEYPHSRHIDEVQFRRGEYFFTRRKYRQAEEAYASIASKGPGSGYYELALYKLGWAFYKQDLDEEALHQYIALLDYKVSTGYDFDQSQDEDAERRIADTYRVISLSFSHLGGPEVVAQYFSANGHRSYEDRIYSQLGEFYFDKLRYQDAAAAYNTFVGLYPLHRSSPHFSMRVVEIYEAGGFPKLVLESKKQFAATYGLQSEYWRHFAVEDSPEVLAYLKANLKDLANHYHALYQDAELAEDKPENFQEALRWYRSYLESFPGDAETPAIHYRMADLLLENEDFGEAAREYEHTAYDYPEHEKAAAAGYAAIYAHREDEKQAAGEEREAIRREAVTSTLRFVDRFPKHEQAAAVLVAAVDDLYDMKEYEQAFTTGRRLIDDYPDAEPSIRRSAWSAIAHSAFNLADYPQAEAAYARVLEMTPSDDDSRKDLVENLAASIYKQGEQAKLAGDDEAAAADFLRVGQAAPGSDIRPLAEYDGAAALIRLEQWDRAAAVLEAFRKAYPDHELHREATKQIALIRRKQGDVAGAAGEYQRMAAEAEEPKLRADALLAAGQLYEDSGQTDRALAVYLDYVKDFPEPIETAVETRSKIAEMYKAAQDTSSYDAQLRKIVEIDRKAGDARTDRVRYLAAQAALVLAQRLYDRFAEVQLVQPFDQNLKKLQRRMQVARKAFDHLVDYEVGEVTAAATYYLAEIHFGFSQALVHSERPRDLSQAELADYERAIEEEASPFEERAIELHQKNLELLAAGMYNGWIEKSLGRLADLVPGRYAKFESSSGLIGSLDSYRYVAPTASGDDATASGSAATAPSSQAEDSASAPAPASDTTPPASAATASGSDAEVREADVPPAAPDDAGASHANLH